MPDSTLTRRAARRLRLAASFRHASRPVVAPGVGRARGRLGVASRAAAADAPGPPRSCREVLRRPAAGERDARAPGPKDAHRRPGTGPHLGVVVRVAPRKASRPRRPRGRSEPRGGVNRTREGPEGRIATASEGDGRARAARRRPAVARARCVLRPKTRLQRPLTRALAHFWRRRAASTRGGTQGRAWAPWGGSGAV